MPRVRVDGRWLHEFTRVGDLRWSHRADHGCYEASWTTSLRTPSQATRLLRRGARVEIFDGVVPVWRGVLSEHGGASSECHAHGLIREASRFLCLDSSLAPTSDITAGIAQAVLDGWDVDYYSGAPASVASEEPQTLAAALSAAATAAGQRVTVRADGVLRFESDPTTPTLIVLPGYGVLGLADEDFATRVTVRYVYSVSGTPPAPSEYRIETAENTAASARYGTASLYVDLTERGLLTPTVAANFAAGVLAKGSARLALTDSLELNKYAIRTAGGQQVSLAHLEAGTLVRLLAARIQDGTTVQAFDMVIGGTDYTAGSGRVVVSPLGLASRNLADVIASTPTRAPIATALGGVV